jgi:hypothetical protein
MELDSSTSNFVLGIIGNLIAGALVIVIAYVWGWLPKRSQRRWMSMIGRKSALQIHTSHLFIKEGGAEPVEGETVKIGFTGAAMNEMEYLSALKLRDALRPSRVFQAAAELFNRRLEQIEVQVGPREWDEQRFAHANLVLLGSPVYNSATKYYLSRQKRVRFSQDQNDQRALHIEDQEFRRSAEYEDYAVICRMNCDDRSVFICAGIGAVGTCEAANHLAKRWQEIKEECGDLEFVALVKKLRNSAMPKVQYPYKEIRDRERTHALQNQAESD